MSLGLLVGPDRVDVNTRNTRNAGKRGLKVSRSGTSHPRAAKALIPSQLKLVGISTGVKKTDFYSDRQMGLPIRWVVSVDRFLCRSTPVTDELPLNPDHHHTRERVC
jgi:hypothetical protein